MTMCVFVCDWWIAAAKVLAFEVVRDGDATSDARILSLKFVLIKRPPAKGESSHLLAAASRSDDHERHRRMSGRPELLLFTKARLKAIPGVSCAAQIRSGPGGCDDLLVLKEFLLIPSLDARSIRLLLTLILVSTAIALWMVNRGFTPAASAQGFPFVPYRNFEGPQVHPLALTPDGTRLLAVNTPNATLSVFQLVSGSPVLTAEIPVGLEPVSVAARNNPDAWVVNWLSDSVSVVDLSTGNVTRTIDVGDEPTDVLFAGLNNEKAFVCVSGGGTQSLGAGGFSTVTGATGAVKVFLDASNPTQGNAQTIQIFGKQPRALARSSDGSRVFVSVFESGNQTTIVSQSDVAANGRMPPPNPTPLPGLPAPPNTGLIVKWNGSAWVDELNRSWNSVIPYTLADIDLVVIDASSAPPLTVSA